MSYIVSKSVQPVYSTYIKELATIYNYLFSKIKTLHDDYKLVKKNSNFFTCQKITFSPQALTQVNSIIQDLTIMKMIVNKMLHALFNVLRTNNPNYPEQWVAVLKKNSKLVTPSQVFPSIGLFIKEYDNAFTSDLSANKGNRFF